MTCEEAAYSENVANYIVNYNYNASLLEQYNSVCTIIINTQIAVVYKEEQTIDAEKLLQYGYTSMPKCYGLMDEAALESVGVLQIRRQPYLELYGTDVIIGFIDTGIDYTHEAFVREDNTSKIISIWDQTIRTGTPPEGISYGSVYTQEELNAALATSDPFSLVPTRDDIGHGTFMAGVAAGRQIVDADFSGAAPDSPIVVVKCKEAKQIYRDMYRIPANAHCYQEDDVFLGVKYILDVATREQKPVIICLGLGTNMGNHNGKSRLGTYINQFSRILGLCFICSAGNEGNTTNNQLPYQEVEIDVEDNALGFVTELWAASPAEFSIQLQSPSGTFTEHFPSQNRRFTEKTFANEGTKLDVYYEVLREESGEQLIWLRLTDTKPGLWKIRVFRDSEFSLSYNMWLPIDEFLQGRTFFLRPDPEATICDPGNVRDIVTVGGFNMSTGGIYIRPSRGDMTFGYTKPDVAAPATEVYGPSPGNAYTRMTGTSVAAALTAGVAAIIMVFLTPQEANGIIIKEALIEGATRKANLAYPNVEWGYGEVNAYSSINTIDK